MCSNGQRNLVRSIIVSQNAINCFYVLLIKGLTKVSHEKDISIYEINVDFPKRSP